jgi:hypothetical protein
LIAWLIVAAVSLFGDGAGSEYADGYAPARAASTARDVPLIVYVHGSDWNQLGERLLDDVWRARRVRAAIGDIDLVLTTIDTLQSPSDKEQETFKVVHEGWKKKGLVTYPALIAYLPDGTVLGSRQGETLPRSAVDARAALIELATASDRALGLRREIAVAKERHDDLGEAAAILNVVDLPLDRPIDLLKRLKEIDPDDVNGLRRRLLLPPWQALIASASKDAKEGRGDEAIQRLQSLLDDDVYSDGQRAWIHAAIGGVHRKTEGSRELALASFKRAWTLDPHGMGGNAGKQWYLELADVPSLQLGWRPSNCTSQLETWVIEDCPAVMAAGVWEITLTYTKGRHALAIESVALVDTTTGEVVSIDTHAGSTGTSTVNNIYRVESPRDMLAPHLQITCQSDGGSDSRGTITLERAE